MNIEEMSLDLFLANNRISYEDWSKANIEFDDLKLIAIDHRTKIPSLDEAAELLASILQKCSQVHSVRWRVKDPEHLIEKIVRKRAENSEKYLSIDINNYTEIVTDLVGVRVLHLFKYEWKNIQDHILSNWEPVETPIAYIRAGDEGEIIDSYKQNKCEVKNHPAGYRSIHYVISTQPTLIKVFSELQVRTIFEEGWSEIDHKIRYPNFYDNELISYFLTILNRMSGSADEMGSFVKDLTAEISIQERKNAEINNKQEKHLLKIEALASALSNEKKESKSKDSKVKKLNDEIQKLRSNTRSSFISEYSGILGGSTAAKLTAVKTDTSGGNIAERLAAIKADTSGGNIAERLVAIKADTSGGNIAARLAAISTDIGVKTVIKDSEKSNIRTEKNKKKKLDTE